MKSSGHSVKVLGFHLFRCGTKKATSLLLRNQIHQGFSILFSKAILPIINVHAIMSLHTVDDILRTLSS